MPELPDVEGFRRILHCHVVGETITNIDVRDPGVVRGQSGTDFVRRLVDKTFVEPARRGKWLLAPTDGPTILLHFGMSGGLAWEPSAGENDRFDRVIFEFGPKRLIYRDQRKLRGLWLVEDEEAIGKVIGPQGPDALGLTGPRLMERLEGHRGSLKSLLMDQHVLAGLGNMLSDEVLWKARIHPARRFGELEPEERRNLDRSLQQALRASVKRAQIPRNRTWLNSQRSSADPRCPRCHSPLQTSRIGGRTSYWCPHCQPSPRESGP